MASSQHKGSGTAVTEHKAPTAKPRQPPLGFLVAFWKSKSRRGMGEAEGGQAESSPCALHARWEQIAAARTRWPCQRPLRGRMLRLLPRSPGCSKGTGISSFPSPAPALCFWWHKHLASPCVLTSNVHLHPLQHAAARVAATGRQPCPSALSPSGLSPQQCPEQLPRAGHAVGLQGGAAGKPAPRFGAGSTPQRWHLLGERKEPHGSLPAPRSPATRRGQAQLCRVPASRETAGSRPW